MRSNHPLSRIEYQVMWNRLISVVEEQAQTLVRTAFGTATREAGDLSAGVYDTQGRMLAQAVTGTPGHVNSMAMSVGHVLDKVPLAKMNDGDAFIVNDPWQGTGHLNDIVIVTPTFRRGKPVGLFACTLHVVDIGGRGIIGAAQQVYEEGLYLPITKIVDRGEMNQWLIDIIAANVREPVQVIGDIYSEISSNEVGGKRLVAMMDEFGLEHLDDLAKHILDHSREASLAAINRLPHGTYHNSMMSLTLASGQRRSFDALLVATGARARRRSRARSRLGHNAGPARFRAMLEQAENSEISRLVFAVPAEAGWPLALYELALLTAARLRAKGTATGDHADYARRLAPLAAFGGRASGAVLEDLEDHGIHFVAGLLAQEIAWGELHAGPGKVRIQADAVVTLPRLRGPAMPGLPHDQRGFIPVDDHCLINGTTNVYAAGDAVAFGIKHGGLAAQQAAAAAEAIAARLGASVTPSPFRPVLRGILLTGGQPRYLEGAIDGNEGAASTRPLWWPPAKIVGRYLAPYLSGQVISQPTAPGACR